MTFRTLRVMNVARCEQRFHMCDDWSETDWATALAGEVGELCNMLKKRRRGEKVSERSLARELADVVTYADLLAERLGIDLGDAVAEKFNVVSKRVGSDIELPRG